MKSKKELSDKLIIGEFFVDQAQNLLTTLYPIVLAIELQNRLNSANPDPNLVIFSLACYTVASIADHHATQVLPSNDIFKETNPNWNQDTREFSRGKTAIDAVILASSIVTPLATLYLSGIKALAARSNLRRTDIIKNHTDTNQA